MKSYVFKSRWALTLAATLVVLLGVGACSAGDGAVGASASSATSATASMSHAESTAAVASSAATPSASATPESTSPPAPPATTTPAAAGDTTCNLPEGDQTVPTTTPKVDAFEPHDDALIPVSSTFGPTQRTGHVWGCFQKSPTGAAFAATYIQLAGTRADSWNFYTIGYEKKDADFVRPPGAMEIVGFKVMDYKSGDALIHLAIKGTADGQTLFIEYPMHMVWVDGTWKAMKEGAPGETKARIVPSIEDFIPWSP